FCPGDARFPRAPRGLSQDCEKQHRRPSRLHLPRRSITATDCRTHPAGFSAWRCVKWASLQERSMGNPQQTVFITGGTDGLGRAAALLLAEKGYRVFAAGRSAEKRAELDRLAASKKLPVESVELDVCNDASVSRAVQLVIQKAGAIDVLINNAGVGFMAVVEELKLDDLRRQYETNVFGLLRVTQAVLPHMRERKAGRILMLSSVAGIVTPPTYGAYSSSKHAVEALSNALRLELYPFNIEVILIEPGYIMTNFQQTAKELAQSYVEGSAASPYAKVYTA